MSLKVFAAITLIAVVCVCLFYFAFLGSLTKIPFSLSFMESTNLWLIDDLLHNYFHPSQFQQAPLFNDFSEGLAYPGLLGSFVVLSGKASHISSAGILFGGRLISILSICFTGLLFFFLLKREKVNPVVALFAVVVFLALPLTQSLTYQARPEALSLLCGVLGIFLFFASAKNFTWLNGLFIGISLALPYVFSHQFAFLGFAFACSMILIVSANATALLKLYLPFIVVVLADLLINSIILDFKGLYPWSLNLWLGNLEIFYAWPLIILLLGTLFLRGTLSNVSINLNHPVGTLFIFGFFVTLWSSGLKIDQGSQWIVVLFALCWATALFVNQLWNQANQKAFQLLSVFVLFLTIFVPLFEPLPYKLVLENPQLVSSRSIWIKQEQILLHQNRRRHAQTLLSQDVSLSNNLKIKTSFSDPNLLYVSEQAYRDLEDKITQQRFNLILLGSSPEKVWPKALLKLIRKNYAPVKKIFVNGEEGSLYEPREAKLDLNERRRQIKINLQQSNTETFATFHRLS